MQITTLDSESRATVRIRCSNATADFQNARNALADDGVRLIAERLVSGPKSNGEVLLELELAAEDDATVQAAQRTLADHVQIQEPERQKARPEGRSDRGRGPRWRR